MSVEQQREKRRYFVRLGSLSDELRLFAYLRSTDRMKQVWQGMQEALAQLHCIIELVGKDWFPGRRGTKLLTWSQLHCYDKELCCSPADLSVLTL